MFDPEVVKKLGEAEVRAMLMALAPQPAPSPASTYTAARRVTWKGGGPSDDEGRKDSHMLARAFYVDWLKAIDDWPDAAKTKNKIEEDFLDTTAQTAADARSTGVDFKEWTRLRKLHLELARTYSWPIAEAIMKEEELALASDSTTTTEVMTFVANFRKAFPQQAKNRARPQKGGRRNNKSFPAAHSTAAAQQARMQDAGTDPRTPVPPRKSARDKGKPKP